MNTQTKFAIKLRNSASMDINEAIQCIQNESIRWGIEHAIQWIDDNTTIIVGNFNEPDFINTRTSEDIDDESYEFLMEEFGPDYSPVEVVDLSSPIGNIFALIAHIRESFNDDMIQLPEQFKYDEIVRGLQFYVYSVHHHILKMYNL